LLKLQNDEEKEKGKGLLTEEFDQYVLHSDISRKIKVLITNFRKNICAVVENNEHNFFNV
jgi:hypothetical protein